DAGESTTGVFSNPERRRIHNRCIFQPGTPENPQTVDFPSTWWIFRNTPDISRKTEVYFPEMRIVFSGNMTGISTNRLRGGSCFRRYNNINPTERKNEKNCKLDCCLRAYFCDCGVSGFLQQERHC
ncbi:MAG: hypothetical protein II739_01785, partial [Clostridia bacterium]|nr:hypothetical protein [Clostridia bacterium]